MGISLIAAAAGKKQVIGRDGDLPWHFSADLKFFKEKTLGHKVVMGRATYQSILRRLGKPLPGRHTVVLTNNPYFTDDRVEILHDISRLPELAANETLFVIGGEQVFSQTCQYADTLYFTYIDQEIAGDAFFPAIDPARWKLSEEREAAENGVALFFRTYRKAK